MKIGAACFMHHLRKLHFRKCSMASKNAGELKTERMKILRDPKFRKENIEAKNNQVQDAKRP